MEVKYVLTKSGHLIFGSKENSHFEISGRLERAGILSAGCAVLPEKEEDFNKMHVEGQLFGFTGKSEYFNRIDESRLKNIQNNLIENNFTYKNIVDLINVLKSLTRTETHFIEVNVRRKLQMK